jgi:acyl-coenzyme A thioesterase PaaI-like protein
MVTLPPEQDGRAMQDVLKVHCFGCGALNAHNLGIRSHWEGNELVCRWQPRPFHIGHPGKVYGGIIASVIDCHAVWTAMATMLRDDGVAVTEGPPPFQIVTARLAIDFLHPAAIDHPLLVRARAFDRSERRVSITATVSQGRLECARADVVVVRLPGVGA